MIDYIKDAIIDTIKIIPFLLLTFIILEFIEHKLTKKSEQILTKNKKLGPILGGILGAIPQCGFSAMAANLFSGRVITIGTLIAIFLSTSDEMLPIMLSKKVNPIIIIRIILFKIITGIIVGLIIDKIIKSKEEKNHEHIHNFCNKEHCHCENGIIISSLKHTLNTALFILIANIIINTIIYFVSEETLRDLLQNKNIIVYFISSLIGLIPNCASSIIITEVYLSKLITIGTALSGLLTGSGLGILLLFKTNKNIKENINILIIIYITGVILGFIVDLII